MLQVVDILINIASRPEILVILGAVLGVAGKEVIRASVPKAIEYFDYRLRKRKWVLSVISDETGKYSDILEEDDLKDVKEDFNVVESPSESEAWSEIAASRFESKESLRGYLTELLSERAVYRREKQVLPVKYRRGLELALKAAKAKREDKTAILENIERDKKEEKVSREFDIFSQILSDKDKLSVFRDEARRRYKRYKNENNSLPAETLREEFTDMIDSLIDVNNRSEVVIMVHSGRKSEVLNRIEGFLKQDDLGQIFLLGRGDNTIEAMNDVRKTLQDKYEGLEFEDRSSYEWDFGSESYMGKQIVLTRE